MYELVGPALSKLGLYLSGSYTKDIDSIVKTEELQVDTRDKNPVEILALKINQIRDKYQSERINPEEDAFNEAVDEFHFLFFFLHRNKVLQ